MNCKIRWPILFLAIAAFILAPACDSQPSITLFDGQHAMEYAQKLMEFGYRVPGSPAIRQAADYINEELTSHDWQVEFQDFTYGGIELRNIIAKKTDEKPDVIIGTHYDTRQISDQETDPALRETPVPGANDGTSGTAVMLEMGRVLQQSDLNIWLVFFDGEDQGEINKWDWSVGAQHFADNLQDLQDHPEAVIVIDMIGDADLNIYREGNSDVTLTDEIWEAAKSAGYDSAFIPQQKYTMLDDHLPFVNLGIPSCLIIDFDYPYWHTQKDVLEKISPDSLNAVGYTLMVWLQNR